MHSQTKPVNWLHWKSLEPLVARIAIPNTKMLNMLLRVGIVNVGKPLRVLRVMLPTASRIGPRIKIKYKNKLYPPLVEVCSSSSSG